MVRADWVETVARYVNVQVARGHDEFAKTGIRHLRSKSCRDEPNDNNYVDNRYCIGVPTSTIPGQAFSGISTRSGDLVTVLVKNLTGVADREAAKLHTGLVAEVILQLKESGSVLLE